MNISKLIKNKFKFSIKFLFIPIILILFFLLFFFVYNDIKDRTIKEFNNELFILAETASQGITSIINEYKTDLVFLSKQDEIIDFSLKGDTLMKRFFENQKNQIEAITRVDAKGCILSTSPFVKSVIGKNISNQKHVNQLLENHEIIISDVFMSAQGYLAIAIHVPIFKKNEFKGSLAVLIPINKLGEKYLGKIKIRGKGNVWLLSEDGVEIYCTLPGHTGRKFIDITQNNPLALDFLNYIKTNTNATIKGIHQGKFINGKFEFDQKYLCFYRTNLGNTYWTIVISYHQEDVYSELSQLRNRLILIFLFLFILISYYFYTNAKISKLLKEERKRKDAEKVMSETEAKFKTIFEETPIGIIIYDTDGQLININKACLNIFGVENISDIIKFNLFNSISLNDELINQLKKGKAINYQVLFDFEIVKELKQYSTIKEGKAYLDYMITPLLNLTDETINGYLVHIQDYTERKHNEDEILMLAHSLKSVNECVSITDMNNIIIFVNEAFLQTYGYKNEELIGQQIDILRPINNKTETIERIPYETLNGGWKGELINKRKDGSTFPIYLSTTIIKDKNDNPIGLIGVASDITDLKIKEIELIKAKLSAEESDRLKTAFLNNISHEIRTPFNGILGFLQLLQDETITNEEKKGFYIIINKSSERLMKTINDIVEVSQIQTSQVKLNISKTNILVSANEIIKQYENEVFNKGLDFKLINNTKRDFPIVSTDNFKLKLIISTLIDNAIKFTNEGKVELNISMKGNYVEFFVKDTGIGIPENLHHKIFEHFMQADVSDTRGFEGSGLGLYIAKSYVEMLGGKIWVESELNKGSSFYFTIHDSNTDNSNENSENKLQIDSKNYSSQQLHILIAEDDEDSVFILNNFLKDLNCEIYIANTGVEAINMFKSNSDINLILMDLKMPDLNGYEACRIIRELNNEVIIIAQSAYAMIGDREKAIDAGCDDYLTKPVKRADLIEMINNYFNLK